jgi:hypothetical protein
MNQSHYSKLAADARTSALRLENAGRSADAAKARADAIRYDRLAKLAALGDVRVG